jgi:hypothetical protein
MADNVIPACSGPSHTFHEAIRGNQVTPYIGGTSDPWNSPVVLEVRRGLQGPFFGQVDDAWQVALTDVGPVGADKGDGGK